MKVLHICNDFCGSKVHSNLYRELDGLGVEQTIFTCYRGNFSVGTNQFEAVNSNFVYRGVLSTKHRFFFHAKINRVYKELMNAVSPRDYNIVHAVTMFSDGVVAHQLYKDYGIPYIISVRNTDINEFMVLAPHTWPSGMNVLRNAKQIVFISKAPMEKFCRHFLVKRILPEIKDRMIVLPNGVDDYWLDNMVTGHPKLNHDIIYVGRFDRNKNVVRLVEAVLELRQEFPDVNLHLVGGDGCKEEKIKTLVAAHPNSLTFHGKIFDKDKLRELYGKCSVFVMPSIHETFGLVYIEAMSQNLAVLYTKNQGIDGLFDNRVGEAVNALSVESIKEGLRKLLTRRENYDFQKSVDFEQFRWNKIAQKYYKLYKLI